MSKAALQSDQERYDEIISRAREHERAGEYAAAVECAVSAWPHLDGMMRFERRWEGQEFSSVPCIDIVLKYAPLLFDRRSLDELGTLLKASKSIDRFATDDLGARLDEARVRVRTAYRLWRHLEANPGSLQSSLRSVLGGSQDEWRGVCEGWAAMGLLQRMPSGGSYQLRLRIDLSTPANGQCHRCGATLTDAKVSLLSDRQCPTCGTTGPFAIVGEPMYES